MPKSARKLRITQCLFVEGRGNKYSPIHQLDLRFAALRQKRERTLPHCTNTRLVGPGEVVVVLAIPHNFPADSRVLVHCMKGKELLPRAVLADDRDELAGTYPTLVQYDVGRRVGGWRRALCHNAATECHRNFAVAPTTFTALRNPSQPFATRPSRRQAAQACVAEFGPRVAR